jgi:hypothetical protein
MGFASPVPTRLDARRLEGASNICPKLTVEGERDKRRYFSIRKTSTEGLRTAKRELGEKAL